LQNSLNLESNSLLTSEQGRIQLNLLGMELGLLKGNLSL